MGIECCDVCDDPTGNAGRGEGSIFVVRNGKEIGPLCDVCSGDFSCSQCGEIAIELHEGYCLDCTTQNQEELDTHNYTYTHWHQLSSAGREKAIKRGYT